jgi:ABC-type multidrug transport system fused ATPase/permease subunit
MLLYDELTLESLSITITSVLVPLVLFHAYRVFGNTKLKELWTKYLEDINTILPYLRPVNKADRRRLLGLCFAVLACVAVGRSINLLTPLLFRLILDKLSSTDEDQRSRFPWQEIIIYVFMRNCLRDALYFLQWLVTRRLENQVLDRITITAYNKIMSLSADYHGDENSTTAWHTVRTSGRLVSTFASQVCFEMVPGLLDLGLAVFTFGIVFGPQMASLMLSVLIAYLIILVKASTERSYAGEKWSKAMMERDIASSSTISNWWTVFLFNRIDFEKERHTKAVDHQSAIDNQWCEERWLISNYEHLVLSSGALLLCLLIAKDISDGRRSGGDLAMFLTLWSSVIDPLQRVVHWKGELETFSLQASHLMKILRETPSIQNSKDAKDLDCKTGTISMKNVTFSYKEKSKPALNNVSFSIEGGRTIAIVGQSGGGKSTLLKLLMRSYDILSGSIQIDGQDIRNVRKESLTQHISIVPQNIGVFNISIFDNLRYANPSATLEECQAACTAVHLHEKISAFEKGYDELVGEGGGKLSGGELQRLAIARVLLRNSKIVLLDEPTSNLDSETEGKIQEHLQAWSTSTGRTMIIVAHRLATIVHADLVLAVKEGEVVESGTVKELLARKGYFFELWNKQKLTS